MKFYLVYDEDHELVEIIEKKENLGYVFDDWKDYRRFEVDIWEDSYRDRYPQNPWYNTGGFYIENIGNGQRGWRDTREDGYNFIQEEQCLFNQ